MWMSQDKMEKKHDYKMKEKVVLEEEESWGRLCTNLVSNNTPNRPFIGHIMFLDYFGCWIKNQKKIINNCK